jgi:hypothetical protein
MTRSRLHMCCCNDTDRILIVTFWEKVVYMYCRCTVTILLIIGFTDYKNVGKIIMVYTLKKNLVNIFQNIDTRCQYCMEWFVLEMQKLSKNEVHVFNVCAITVQSWNNVVKKKCNLIAAAFIQHFLLFKCGRSCMYTLLWWIDRTKTIIFQYIKQTQCFINAQFVLKP